MNDSEKHLSFIQNINLLLKKYYLKFDKKIRQNLNLFSLLL